MSRQAAPRVNAKELRQFGLLFGLLLMLFFGLLLPWLWGRPWPQWPWLAGGALWLWALVLPRTIYYPYRGWMAVGAVLGWINTRILMSIVFNLVVLPTGLVLRLMGRDPLHRRLDPGAESYRVPATADDPKHMERPF
jgi:hypothetical protein